jgi:hypothetical protein
MIDTSIRELFKRKKEEADGVTIGVTLDVVQQLITAPARISKSTAGLVGAPTQVGMIIAKHVASQSLDTTLTDALDAIGDAHFSAAIATLRDAENEPLDSDKSDLRLIAEGQLRDAYAIYMAEEDRVPPFPPMASSKRV